MGYYIDLTSIEIDEYKEKLKTSDLLPSRMILKENIDLNFERIKAQNVHNLEQLFNLLKTKKKLQEFAKQSGLDETYLTILIRELKSYRPKPNKIKDFPNVSEDTVIKLESCGIKNSLQLFDKVLTSQSRKELSSETEIDNDELLKVAKLSDLSRIKWVNHTFAYVLYEANYDSADKVAHADHTILYDEVKTLNAERALYKGYIGLNDMKLCVEAAQNLPIELVI